jgi:hypothetical protein
MLDSDQTNKVWQDLVLSILAVNSYSLERAYSLAEHLMAEGMFDPNNLIKWDVAEISVRLNRAGYNRGPYMTGLFSKRLSGLGKFISRIGVSQVEKTLLSGDGANIKSTLATAPGIGPVVLRNLFALRAIK